MHKSISFLTLNTESGKEASHLLRWQDDIFFIKRYEFPTICPEAFLTDFALIFLMGKGNFFCELNSRKYEAIAPCLVIFPPDTLHKVIDESKDIEKKTLFLSKNLIDGMFMNRRERFFLNQALFSKPVIPLSKKQYQNLLPYFNLIESELQETENPNRIKTIQKLLEALITKYPISEIIRNVMTHPRDRKESLLQRFHLALHDFYRQQRSVSFYADILSVTPQYLSKVTKEKSGKSAIKLIENYVIENIKTSLLHEDRSLKNIADDFHFGSFDLMNKYFKRSTGFSLAEYRKTGGLAVNNPA